MFFQIATRRIEPAMVQGEHLRGFRATAQPASVGVQIIEGGVEIPAVKAEPCQGGHTPGADPPFAGLVKNEAVPAQTLGLDIQGAHMGAHAADMRAAFAQPHPSVFQGRDIRGGAAHVDHHGIVQTGEVPGAGYTGRRPGENGLHRALHGEVLRHKRAVAAHHHHRCPDARLFKNGGDILQQPGQAGDDPGVVHRRLSAHLEIEQLGQFMAARDETAGFRHKNAFDRHLVIRVDRAGIPGDGKRLDPLVVAHAAGDAADLRFIKRRQLFAGDIRSSRQHGLRRMDHFLIFIEARRRHQQQPHLLPVVFDDGVGGERSGDRHELDLPDLAVLQSGERLPDSDGKIPFGGQRLVFGQHLLRPEIIDHGIGVGAAGIDAQADMKLAERRRRRVARHHHFLYGPAHRTWR